MKRVVPLHLLLVALVDRGELAPCEIFAVRVHVVVDGVERDLEGGEASIVVEYPEADAVTGCGS